MCLGLSIAAACVFVALDRMHMAALCAAVVIGLLFTG